MESKADNGRRSGTGTEDGSAPFVSTKFEREEQVGVKLINLPWRITVDEVKEFFQEHKPIENSIVFETNEETGRRNGKGGILFENEDDAQKAQESLDGQQYPGDRTAKLFVCNYGQYSRLNQQGGGGGSYSRGQGNEVKLSEKVNDGNKPKSLVMKGLPWKITMQEIIDFFADYGTIPESDIFIEESGGKRTGAALVVFESEDKAQEAKEGLNKQNIGTPSRYVDLFDSGDNFYKKVCGLFDD